MTLRGTKRAIGAGMGEGSIGHLTGISDTYQTSKGLTKGSNNLERGHNWTKGARIW